MEREKIEEKAIKIFWLFVIGSFLGFLVETVVVLVQKGYYESRQGLIYGPFTPVYGIGIVFYYCAIGKIKNTGKVFLLSMILGGMIEYFCSYFQEQFFGTISWDYSNLYFNVNGRTSLLHCLYWGMGGVIANKLLFPYIDQIQNQSKKYFRMVTIVCLIFMLWNIQISCMAASRQEERRKMEKPENQWEMFLDKHFPDDRMNRIYANKMDKMK